MASADIASKWLQFFKNAGLPATVAANYAILFANHRMQIDMLGDLSRDILQAMGITAMGDIIAVLKHAKEIDAENTREKTLGFGTNQPSAVVSPNPTKPMEASRRVVTHSQSQKALVPPLKTSKSTSSSRKIISLKQKQVEEVPVKKIRRVLPQHEGAYQVKMPSGSTERTRRLLALKEQSPVLKSKKSSVFDRLGESNVSSTTGSDGPKTNASTTLNKTSTSVFSRLGPGVDVTSTSQDRPTRVKVSEMMTLRCCNVSDSVARKQSIKERLGGIHTGDKNSTKSSKPNLGVALKFIQQQAASEGILANAESRKRKESVHSRLDINRQKDAKIMKKDNFTSVQSLNTLDRPASSKKLKLKREDKSNVFNRLG